MAQDHRRGPCQGRPHVRAVHARGTHRPRGEPDDERGVGGALGDPGRRPDVDRLAGVAAQRHAARARNERNSRRHRRVRAGDAQRDRRGLRRRGAALGVRLSADAIPLDQLEPAHGCVRRHAAEPAPLRHRNARGDGQGGRHRVAHRHQAQSGDAVQRHPRRQPGGNLHGAGEGDFADGSRVSARAAIGAAAECIRVAASAVQRTVPGRRRIRARIRQRRAGRGRGRLYRLRQAVPLEPRFAGAFAQARIAQRVRSVHVLLAGTEGLHRLPVAVTGMAAARPGGPISP